jgi:uncharacterized membrane protein
MLSAMLLVSTVAQGQVTIEWIGEGAATAISHDGSVVVGNSNGSYETFRWTSDTGIQLLGRSTTAVLGTGAGGPDVSDDGQYISATILGEDETYGTVGRWSLDNGWEEMMPPTLPDGGLFSEFYGSAWGISDDGSSVVGLYWRPGQPGGSANGLFWNEGTGLASLGATVGNSRANDANADGTVIVGWDEAPFGYWMPTVWENGVLTHLTETEAWCMADGITPDGNMIVGSSAAPGENSLREAAVWIRNGDSWDEHLLGVLPGTNNPFGNALARDVSDDGSIIVGFNAWDPGNTAGFIWTMEDGMMNVVDFLADNGISIGSSRIIVGLNGISGDGNHIAGIAQQTVWPFSYESFIIHMVDLSPVQETPVAFQLDANYPNPFNPQTTIPVTMGREGNASLQVYDTAGRLVRTLHHGMLSQGRHEFIWNGRDRQGNQVSSGVYFSRVTDPSGQSLNQRMVLVK